MDMGRGTLPVSSLDGQNEGGRRRFGRNREQYEMALGLTDEMTRSRSCLRPSLNYVTLGESILFASCSGSSYLTRS